jgi:hypothetical protein
MVSHKAELTFEQAVRWNEQLLTLFPAVANRRNTPTETQCETEFVL